MPRAKLKMLDSIKTAIEAVKTGTPVVVVDDENRENEGDLIVAAEKITTELINFMARECCGLVCTPVAPEIAEKIGFEPMVKNCDPNGQHCNFAITIDLKEGIESGISAADRTKTIQKILEPGTTLADFVQPGHVFPLLARAGGVRERPGHTEATVELARLAGLAPAGVLCEVTNEDGTMARLPELREFAKKHGFPLISIADLIDFLERK